MKPLDVAWNTYNKERKVFMMLYLSAAFRRWDIVCVTDDDYESLFADAYRWIDALARFDERNARHYGEAWCGS